MRKHVISVFLMLGILFSLGSSPGTAGSKPDLGHEALAANDGWGSYGPGVTGGALAAPEQVYTVTNRQELVAALNNGVYPPVSSTPSNLPKIIYVAGTIDANVDDNNQPLTCEDYAQGGFTWESFLAKYDPETWGRVTPGGPLEAARGDSRNAQQARVRIRVGDNTTIVGLDKHATMRGVWLDIRGSRSGANQTPRHNIIIRNLTFEDTYDCFPAWSPTDGALGAWNAEYDSISLRESVNVWIDHNTFRDRETSDGLAPLYFGVLFQRHDGLVDITNASDLVTVSWNRFEDHDKVMLIGSSDSTLYDTGRLRVTLHHNLFDGTGQRTPRVRFGQVHVYNNYYKFINDLSYVYAWGVGIASQIYAENNAITTDQSIAPAGLIGVYRGTMLYETGTSMNGTPGNEFVDVVAEFNALFDPDLSPSVSWAPALFTSIDPTQRVIPLVESGAGPFNW
ncbi:MAG: pectate lyase [Chloroflexota bacterium]|nr:MAG: pectate lyase [Chloroflexota bacterium]